MCVKVEEEISRPQPDVEGSLCADLGERETPYLSSVCFLLQNSPQKRPRSSTKQCKDCVMQTTYACSSRRWRACLCSHHLPKPQMRLKTCLYIFILCCEYGFAVWDWLSWNGMEIPSRSSGYELWAPTRRRRRTRTRRVLSSVEQLAKTTQAGPDTLPTAGTKQCLYCTAFA